MITPTVGRIVLYRPNHRAPAQAAIVCHVNDDRNVNLAVFSSTGSSHGATDIPLVQEGDEVPSRDYCEWMPYQKGQAQKTEQLEKALSEKPA